MSRLLSSLLFVLFATSCGDTASHVASGSYFCDGEADATGALVTPTPELTLTVDVSTSSATLGSTPLTLELAPESEWLKDCFTNTSHATSDVYTVKPNPLIIGQVSIDDPILSRKCGGRHVIAPKATGTAGVAFYFSPNKTL